MYRAHSILHHVDLLVVIDDLDIEYVAILELETNTPLVTIRDRPLIKSARNESKE